MRNKIRYLLLFLCLAQEITATIFLPQNHLSTESTKPIIVFDVDGVLADRNLSLNHIKQCYQIFKESSHKWDLCKTVYWIYSNSQLLDEIVNKYDDEQARCFIAKQNPVLYEILPSGKTILEQYHEIKNSGVCFHETLNIVHELYKNNYILAIATNHSRNTFNHLSKTDLKLPHNYFVTICTSDSIVPEQFEKGFIKKPAARYFNHLKECICQKIDIENNMIIFVDDNITNVKAAVQEGFVGIHFICGKNLREDLDALGIKIDKNTNIGVPDRI